MSNWKKTPDGKIGSVSRAQVAAIVGIATSLVSTVLWEWLYYGKIKSKDNNPPEPSPYGPHGGYHPRGESHGRE